MFPDYGLLDKFPYSGEKCLDLYIQYKEGTATIDDLLRYVKRHVMLRVRKAYLKRVRLDVCEDLVQEVMIELWLMFTKSSTIPTDNVARYHAFLNTVIRRRISKAFDSVYDDAPKNLDPEKYMSEICGRVPCSDEEDLRLLRQGLPETLRARILGKNWSDADRPAVEYILDQLLVYQDEDIVRSLLKRVYKVKDPDFLVQRVLILLRAEMYALREDIVWYPSREKKDTIYESFGECGAPE